MPTAEKPLTAPTIHINGTSPASLMEGYTKALHALTDAYVALAATAPHMRDYYVQPDGGELFHIARDNHIARLKRIEECKTEIEALGLAVIEQAK